VQRLDGAGAHPLDDDRGLHEVAPELREQHAARHRAHLVPGPPHPLQPAGHAGRGLDLDDEVDGAHVDAELERAGGDHRGEPTGLELLLDELAVFLAHRAVVGPGQGRRRAGGGARLRHQLGRGARPGMPAGRLGGRHAGVVVDAVAGTAGRCLQPLLPDLVQPRGQPLRQPPGVREHQGRAVRRDEVDDALLDVRPDGGALLGTRGRPGEVVGDLAQRRHVGDRHDDLEVPRLGGGRAHDLDGPAAGEVARDLLDRLDGRGQPDSLRGALEQRVEALEAEREVGAALGAGHGVDLVDDDRLDAGQRLPGLRGEDEEQGLGRRDEHVAGSAREGAPLVRRGVAGSHRDGDVRHRQAEAGGRVADPDERRPQVALDVDGQRLHRRDVEDPAPLEPLEGRRLRGQPVQRPEERGQGLARPGGRHDEGVVP
jgi:hypothetical protein